MAKRGLAKALERKMGLDEGILTKIKTKDVKSSLIMNFARRRIFEYICNFPASHLRKISRDLGYSTQTVKWHLNKLVEGGLISSHYFGKKRVFAPLKERIPVHVLQVISLLYDNEIKQIIIFIGDNYNVTQKEMGTSLGIYQQRLSRILITLEKNGVIAHEKRGREKVYYTTNLTKEIRASFDNEFPKFQNALIAALRADGVAPYIKTSHLKTLTIEIDVGGDEKAVLRIQKNPFRMLLKG